MTRARERLLRRTQGCLTDCVAYYFNLHPDRVPLFIAAPQWRWRIRLRAYFRRRGYHYVRWTRTSRVPTRGTHIVCWGGANWRQRGRSHAVVYRQGRVVYDPARRRASGHVTHRLIVRRTR